jgi:hypothetical protein
MLRSALFAAMLLVGIGAVVIPDALAVCNYDLNGVGYGTNGESCPYRGGGNRRVTAPQGPSPMELQQQREAKDLDEATQDAWDKGVARYHASDWAGAIRYFREALSYDPDNASIRHNLQMAEEKQNAQRQANDSLAAHQAKSLAAQGAAIANGGAPSSDAAIGAQSRVGFDTAGKDTGGIAVDASTTKGLSGDPVVPPGKRTPAITALEAKRASNRGEIAALDVQLKKLDPTTNAVEIAKLKQQRTTAEQSIHYLNFEINEAIVGPKQ